MCRVFRRSLCHQRPTTPNCSRWSRIRSHRTSTFSCVAKWFQHIACCFVWAGVCCDTLTQCGVTYISICLLVNCFVAYLGARRVAATICRWQQSTTAHWRMPSSPSPCANQTTSTTSLASIHYCRHHRHRHRKVQDVFDTRLHAQNVCITNESADFATMLNVAFETQ